MAMLKQIEKEKQIISLAEKSLTLEKIKQRKADTRRKIELGGLVIKATFDGYNKSILLGALRHSLHLINQDSNYLKIFESLGNEWFSNQ